MITVLFQTESHYPVNRRKVKEAVAAALTGQVRRAAEVSISVVGDRAMRRLNLQYRKLDQTTDVLSFPLSESSVNVTFVNPPDSVLRLGDIVISFPQAVKTAAEDNKMVDDVIVELALHGLNHLLGIHHP